MFLHSENQPTAKYLGPGQSARPPQPEFGRCFSADALNSYIRIACFISIIRAYRN